MEDGSNISTNVRRLRYRLANRAESRVLIEKTRDVGACEFSVNSRNYIIIIKNTNTHVTLHHVWFSVATTCEIEEARDEHEVSSDSPTLSFGLFRLYHTIYLRAQLVGRL